MSSHSKTKIVEPKRQVRTTFWNPRIDPNIQFLVDQPTFSRPRMYDYSDVAWDKNLDFWYQREPMTEYYYSYKQEYVRK